MNHPTERNSLSSRVFAPLTSSAFICSKLRLQIKLNLVRSRGVEVEKSIKLRAPTFACELGGICTEVDVCVGGENENRKNS